MRLNPRGVLRASILKAKGAKVGCCARCNPLHKRETARFFPRSSLGRSTGETFLLYPRQSQQTCRGSPLRAHRSERRIRSTEWAIGSSRVSSACVIVPAGIRHCSADAFLAHREPSCPRPDAHRDRGLTKMEAPDPDRYRYVTLGVGDESGCLEILSVRRHDSMTASAGAQRNNSETIDRLHTRRLSSQSVLPCRNSASRAGDACGSQRGPEPRAVIGAFSA